MIQSKIYFCSSRNNLKDQPSSTAGRKPAVNISDHLVTNQYNLQGSFYGLSLLFCGENASHQTPKRCSIASEKCTKDNLISVHH